MTNTKVNKVNKCRVNDCSHSKKFIDRYDVIDGKVIKKDNHKWHFCLTCDKVVHKDYINWHEMRCSSFHELRKNCIAKNHTHSEHVACNL